MQTPRALPLLLAIALSATFLPAQTPTVTPELQHRIEVTVRNHFNLPPEMQLQLAGPSPSDIPGYNNINVTVTNGDKVAGKVTMLLSQDMKTLLGVVRFDLTKDPAAGINVAGRPIRGNPNAPIKIIVFDDLECPYCAQMHARMFPATPERYKDQVAFIYKDFPLTQIHPWAMHAAVDVNCVAKLNTPESAAAYWRLVDSIHAQASHITALKGSTPTAPKTAPNSAPGAAPRATSTLTPIFEHLDTMTRDEATHSHLDLAAVNACIAKQDTTAIDASVHEGDALSLNSTPTLYVDGEKMEGALDIDLLNNTIDDALQARGLQPPAKPAPAPTAIPTGPPAAAPVSSPAPAAPNSPSRP